MRTRFFLLLLPLCSAASGQAVAVSYTDVAPILQARCVVCHSGPTAPMKLELDSLQNLLKGSRNGAIVQAGDAQASELIKRVKGLSLPRMPMSGPPFLTEPEIELLERWVASGLNPGSAEGVGEVAAAPSRPQAGEVITYTHVAPIFARRCSKCHSANGLLDKPPEGYELTSYQATLSGAERVEVVPGVAEASELVRRIRGDAEPRMPYDGPPYLSDEDIALIVQWIDQGARAANGQPAPVPIGKRVRLHGILGEGWTLDGLSLEVNPKSRIDQAVGVGRYVEVRGRLGAGGVVTVDRIRPR
jgi:mono/diheme cytochrome c family protein